MATYYTPIVDGEQGNAATFNTRFQELEDAIGNASNVMGAIQPWTELGGNEATIDITAIPSTYSILHLVALLKSSTSGTPAELVINVNNDTTQANYYALHALHAVSVGGVTEQLGTGFNGWGFASALVQTGTSQLFSVMELKIYRYASTNVFKQMTYQGYAHQGDSSNTLKVLVGGGVWKQTSAITSLKMAQNSADTFVAGSRYALFGIT